MSSPEAIFTVCGIGVTLSDAIVAVTCIILVCHGIIFWCTVIDARKKEKRELRAYISIDEHPTAKPKLEATATFPLQVVNSGKTRAENLVVFCKVTVVDPLAIKIEMLELVRKIIPDVAVMDLAPNGHSSTIFAVPAVPLNETGFNLQEWNRHIQTILIYGAIVYSDIFGNIWQTNFAFTNQTDAWRDGSFDNPIFPAPGLNYWQQGNYEQECTGEILQLYKAQITAIKLARLTA